MWKTIEKNNLCQCGCGLKCYNKYVQGHSNRINHPKGMLGKTAWNKDKTYEDIKGPEWAQKFKQKISVTKLEQQRKPTPEQRMATSKRLLGNTHVLGKHWKVSEEVKKAASLRQKGKKKPEQTERNYKLLEEGKIGWRVSRHTRGESYPEKRFNMILIKLGMLEGVDYTRELPVGRWCIDFALQDAKIAIEIDGKQHLKEDALLRDKRKDAYLESLGWLVLRYTAAEVLKMNI